MKCLSAGAYISLLSFILISTTLPAQPVTMHPVELSIKRPDINRQTEETELVLSFRNIGREFLKVKGFNMSLHDDQGNNLIEKGRDNLKAYEKKGFFTSRSTDWEQFNYAFYHQKDAFGGKIIAYSAPSVQTKQLVLRGEVQIWVKGKNDRTKEIRLNNIMIKTDSTYNIEGGVALKFFENGRLTLDNAPYANFKIITEIPLSSVDVVGQKKFLGIAPSPDEVYVRDGQAEVSLILNVPDAEVMVIPVDLRIGIGL